MEEVWGVEERGDDGRGGGENGMTDKINFAWTGG